jgi:hypothetical protein
MKRIISWFNYHCGWFFLNGNKQPKYTESCVETMKSVGLALEDAKESGLETEVVVWALKYMKENPKLTISEAIFLGYCEWVK